MRFIQLRLAPAEKLRPLAASTTTRTEASASRSCNARVSAAIIASSNALCMSGRSSVTVAMPRVSVATVMPVRVSREWAMADPFGKRGLCRGQGRYEYAMARGASAGTTLRRAAVNRRIDPP